MLEVQSYQAGMKQLFECGGRGAALLPHAAKARPARRRVDSARAQRFVCDHAPGERAVRVTDSSRLRVLHALLPFARSLGVYADDAQQANAWVVDFGEAG